MQKFSMKTGHGLTHTYTIAWTAIVGGSLIRKCVTFFGLTASVRGGQMQTKTCTDQATRVDAIS